MPPIQRNEPEASGRSAALNEAELAQQDAVDLPPREAMTILDLMPATTGSVPVPPAAGGGSSSRRTPSRARTCPRPTGPLRTSRASPPRRPRDPPFA